MSPGEQSVSRDCGSRPGPHRTTPPPQRSFFHWITGLRPQQPLRYPVTNLTSSQSKDAARPASTPCFALRHSDQSKSSPAGRSWEQSVEGRDGEVEGGWREPGWSHLGGWSGGRAVRSNVVTTAAAWEIFSSSGRI